MNFSSFLVKIKTMQHVIMTKGLQASGKSTWAKSEVRRSAGTFKRINKDDLRMMVDNEWSAAKEKFILKARDVLLVEALKQGFNVIIDDTNLDHKHWKDVNALLMKLDIDVTLREQCFHVDLDEAIKRDAARQNPVGEAAIRNTWNRYIKGKTGVMQPKMEVMYARKHHSALQQDQTLEKAIICDLDGTLAIMGDRSPYDASKCDEKDYPNKPVVETVKLFHKAGYKIIFVSGRDEKDRAPTERFIIQHCPDLSATFIRNEMNRLNEQYREAPSEEIDLQSMLLNEQLSKISDQSKAILLMRKNKDMRSDTIVKREIWDAEIAPFYNVLCAIDDRPSVCRLWRYDVGLPCFQVNDKEF